jgi:hypothetical protein
MQRTRSVLIGFKASWFTSNSLSRMGSCLVFVSAVEVVKIADIVNNAFTRLDATEEVFSTPMSVILQLIVLQHDYSLSN